MTTRIPAGSTPVGPLPADRPAAATPNESVPSATAAGRAATAGGAATPDPAPTAGTPAPATRPATGDGPPGLAETGPAGRPRRDRSRAARLIVGYAAILGTLPYLTLKFSWLLGGDIGIVDPTFMRHPQGVALNAFTAGLDVAAIAVALAFTHRWGQRLPAWLVLLPIWVGTGLLATIVLAYPSASLAELAAGTASVAETPDLPLQPWVWTVVYTGFTWQGLTLLTAFVLYARRRWPAVFTARVRAPRPDVFATAGVPIVAIVGVVHLAWAFGVRWGLPAGLAEGERDITANVLDATYGLLALAAVAGTVLLNRRGTRLWLPTVLVWTGAGAMSSWAGWTLLTVFSAVFDRASLGYSLIMVAQLLGGALLGLVLIRRVAALPVPSR